jgi:nucleotide-binding universal stress UspA family protein
MTQEITVPPVVLVALDASPQSLAALETAARFASRLNAELRGMYVEDIDLVRTAELPFARAITHSGQSHPLTPETMQRQLNRHADMARNAVEAVGMRRKLVWSFSVVRGTVYREIARAASVAEFVTVGRSGWSFHSGKQLGSVARSLAEGGTTSLLLVGEDGVQDPLAVIYDGSPSSDRALALATALDGSGSFPITVIVVGVSAMEQLRRKEIPPRIEIVPADSERPFENVRSSGAKTLLIPSSLFKASHELAAIFDRRNLSVLLVK